MQFPTLILCMAINVAMVATVSRIFAMVCCGYQIFIFSSFFFVFPSLEALCCSFCFYPLDCALFSPILSRYCSSTQASSTDLGLKNITCPHRWWYRPPKYLRSTCGFFGELPIIIAIFLNYVVYSCMLWPRFFLK